LYRQGALGRRPEPPRASCGGKRLATRFDSSPAGIFLWIFVQRPPRPR